MSRFLAGVAVGFLLACVSRAAHLETVFSASLPYPEVSPTLPIGGPSSLILGDGLYVVCGVGSTVEAFNLTTRTNMWVSPNLTSDGPILSFAVSSEAVLVQIHDYQTIVALSTKTGQQLWVQQGYQLMVPAAALSYGTTVYAAVLFPPNDSALQAFDLATGTPGAFQLGNALQIDGNTAFAAQFSVSPSTGLIFNETVRAIDIPTNTTLWTVPSAGLNAEDGRVVVAVSSEYVLVSNLTGNDEVALVLHRKNGTVARSLQAFNGLQTNGRAKFEGNTLFALIGLEYPRYVMVDLTTGYITWTRSAGEVGLGGILSGSSVVAISQSLVLTVSPLGGNSPSITIPQVPSLPAPAIVDFGFGVVLVGNLQGYTMWDTTTGNFLGSNEQDPNGALSAPLKWNGLSVTVSGNVVTALKVAA